MVNRNKILIGLLLSAIVLFVSIEHKKYKENIVFLESLGKHVSKYNLISDPFLRTYSPYVPEYYQKIQEEERRPHYGIPLRSLS